MRPNNARHSFLFILIHWVLALTILILLGLGWYIRYLPPTAPSRSFLLDLHTSLGLTSAILLSIQLLLHIALKPSPFHSESPRWLVLLAGVLNVLIYLSLISILISGYLRTVFSMTPIEFWKFPIPLWGVVDPTLAKFFGTTHRISAFVLAGSLVAHTGLLGLNLFTRPKTVIAPQTEAQESYPLVPEEARPSIAPHIVQRVAGNLRLFGWIEFWVQFVFSLSTALLLAFATSGRVFSPASAGFFDGIYWAGYGFLLLCASVFLSFRYTRAARNIVAAPDSFLSPKHRRGFWFLGVGALVGVLGVLISFTGVGMSLSLLIAKTVSQPPGIAITDPANIIRALDVFVLIVNFILLMAHFVGVGVAFVLSMDVAKARHEYAAIRRTD